jgi:DNA-directed RNA polymerase specialized sigma24 family protein
LEQLDDETEIIAPDLDPEMLVIHSEAAEAFEWAMSQIDSDSALLLRLRYEQGLTLAAVAELSGLKNAQTADRRIRQVLERVRGLLTFPHGKTAAGSVKEGSGERNPSRHHAQTARLP